MGTERRATSKSMGNASLRGVLIVLLAGSVGVPWAEEPTAWPLGAEGKEIVATVGDREISANMLRKEIVRRGGFRGQRARASSTKTAALDELVRVEVLAPAALKAGLGKDPEIVDAHKRLLAEKYWREQFGGLSDQMKVSDEEIRDDYESHRGAFKESIRARAAVIFSTTRRLQQKTMRRSHGAPRSRCWRRCAVWLQVRPSSAISHAGIPQTRQSLGVRVDSG